ncbi:MAG: hypothetical protein ACXWCY_24430 [Burkholderiales bacterium]
MDALTSNRIFQAVRSLGPYLLIELLLPGGTLLALLLWLYQRRAGSMSAGTQQARGTQRAIEHSISRSRSRMMVAAEA